MSIFSRLRKRGPEEGGPTAAEPADPPAAAKPAPAPREAAPAPTPPAAPSASKNGAARPEPKAAPPNGHPASVTKPYHAVVKPASATSPPAPGMVPPRNTPPRTAPVAPPASPAPAPAARTAPAAAEAPRPAPAAPPPAPTASKPAAPPAKEEAAPTQDLSAPGSLEIIIERALADADAATAAKAAAASAPASSEGSSTAGDRRAVMATFEELAVGHTAQVRSFMLEVRWGEAQTSWIELSRPALKSLRSMAVQMEHTALIAALDGFDAVLAEMLRPGAPPVIGPAARDKLMPAYAPLITVLPGAFELQGERDRREPLVVRALLQQVAGLDPLMIDKMMAAGLGRLEALFRAKADEIAAVAGISGDVAAAVAARVQAFKRATPALLATPDLGATARELGALFQKLETEHRGFEDASRGWSEGDRDAKKRLRREREISFLQITIVLARLGEVDLALRLEKVAFARRIEELERLVSRMAPLRASAPAADASGDGQTRKMEREVHSGAHAAP